MLSWTRLLLFSCKVRGRVLVVYYAIVKLVGERETFLATPLSDASALRSGARQRVPAPRAHYIKPVSTFWNHSLATSSQSHLYTTMTAIKVKIALSQLWILLTLWFVWFARFSSSWPCWSPPFPPRDTMDTTEKTTTWVQCGLFVIGRRKFYNCLLQR